MDEARRWAEKFVRLPPQHVRATKALMVATRALPGPDTRAREQEIRNQLAELDDSKEAVWRGWRSGHPSSATPDPSDEQVLPVASPSDGWPPELAATAAQLPLLAAWQHAPGHWLDAAGWKRNSALPWPVSLRMTVTCGCRKSMPPGDTHNHASGAVAPPDGEVVQVGDATGSGRSGAARRPCGVGRGRPARSAQPAASVVRCRRRLNAQLWAGRNVTRPVRSIQPASLIPRGFPGAHLGADRLSSVTFHSRSADADAKTTKLGTFPHQPGPVLVSDRQRVL